MATNPIYPPCIWDCNTLHVRMLESLKKSYDALCHEPGFDEGWRNGSTVQHRGTLWRQTPMLGIGGDDGRQQGGFWEFARAYIGEQHGEAAVASLIRDCCSFTRYNDFQFCHRPKNEGWGEGKKRVLIAAEVESHPAELFGELTNLLSVRCPFKFFYIAESKNALKRLNDFCCEPGNCAADWAGTHYLVVEIPDNPSGPDTWKRYRADVAEDRGQLNFREGG